MESVKTLQRDLLAAIAELRERQKGCRIARRQIDRIVDQLRGRVKPAVTANRARVDVLTALRFFAGELEPGEASLAELERLARELVAKPEPRGE